MSTRIFGTDGIRGRAGHGWLAPALAAAVGHALGQELSARGGQALLGHDGRASGPGLEAAVAHGLARAGLSCHSAGLITTPGLAWLARAQKSALAVMISASHNPAEDNGIKAFGCAGEKLSDEQELAIEARLAGAQPWSELGAPLAVEPELARAYERHLIDAAAGLELGGLYIALDCANGGGSALAPRVLTSLGARVDALFASPDGANINHGCGAVHPEALQRAVLERGASLGIALDGDGDRCVLVDERGALVDGDGILTVCASHLARQQRLRPARIAATVMSNRGLHRALRAVGVGVVDTEVGDRKVVEAMKREGLGLGGEQSGHVVFGADNAWIGDGTYTALQVLRVMRESGRPLSELAAPYQVFPQVLLNVPVRAKPPLAEVAGLSDALAEAERTLAPDGRVLLRYSGTESKARVMVEGPDAARIRAEAERLAALLRAAIGA